MGRRFGRRDFLKFAAAGSLPVLMGQGGPNITLWGETMDKDLLDAIDSSDVTGAVDSLKKKIKGGTDPWKIHLSLFPVVQRVMNPPFINPHLPKMYRICRELAPYLPPDKFGALVFLEVSEYSRRPKMEKIPKESVPTSSVAFKDIEMAIKGNDPAKASLLITSFIDQKGGTEFARRLLLLGSGYLNHSLGHSVSCTAFILLEMLERTDQDAWPAICALANYFCKGGFHKTPEVKPRFVIPEKEEGEFIRATSGQGIVNLHHTITRYAIERTRNFLAPEEYSHMILSWIDFMGDKEKKPVAIKGSEDGILQDYSHFYKIFSERKAMSLASSLQTLKSSDENRSKLSRFLIQGLCDQYQSDYNPHYVTGLGSVLWVLEKYWMNRPIAANALYQYLDFFFGGSG
jgi:hypothetical protein